MLSPWLQSLVLANANEGYSLYDLIAATFGAPPQPPKWQGVTAQFAAIQFDPNTTGSDPQLAIGNSQVAFNNCGCIIFPGQSFPIYSMDASLIDFKSIFVMSNTAGVQINLSFIQR